MDFPKTLVIGIFTHGEQPLDDDNVPKLTTLHPNISIHKIDMVLPGIANVSTVDNFENIGNSISQLINNKKINWDEMTSEDSYALAKQLAYKVINEHSSMNSQINKDYNYSISKGEPIPYLAQYVHNSSHPLRILSYKSDEQMPDKLFTKINPGELVNPDNIPENYCGKIVMLNVEGEPDIFEIIEGFDDTPFSGLNAFFEAMEVKNLIVVDLSCNVFPNIQPSSRLARRLRRSMLTTESSTKIDRNPRDLRTYRRKSRKAFSRFPKNKGGKKMRNQTRKQRRNTISKSKIRIKSVGKNKKSKKSHK
jgi:hypothetical protein